MSALWDGQLQRVLEAAFSDIQDFHCAGHLAVSIGIELPNRFTARGGNAAEISLTLAERREEDQVLARVPGTTVFDAIRADQEIARIGAPNDNAPIFIFSAFSSFQKPAFQVLAVDFSNLGRCADSTRELEDGRRYGDEFLSSNVQPRNQRSRSKSERTKSLAAERFGLFSGWLRTETRRALQEQTRRKLTPLWYVALIAADGSQVIAQHREVDWQRIRPDDVIDEVWQAGKWKLWRPKSDWERAQVFGPVVIRHVEPQPLAKRHYDAAAIQNYLANTFMPPAGLAHDALRKRAFAWDREHLQQTYPRLKEQSEPIEPSAPDEIAAAVEELIATDRLTCRQAEVEARLDRQIPPSEIAKQLVISPSAVTHHHEAAERKRRKNRR